MVRQVISKLFRTVLVLLFASFGANSVAQDQCRLLVWADEFDYIGIPDSTKWAYDLGDGSDIGLSNWGNKEAQYYTYRDLDNARVENGILTIEARKELMVNKEYSSARLVTRGIMDITYGRVEFRVKMAGGEGVWSALWLLGDRKNLGWPMCGEIDVLEYVGQYPGIARGTVHQSSGYAAVGPTNAIDVFDAETAFHIYAIEWNQDSISWYVDDEQYHVYYNEYVGEDQWPYDHKFYLIMNLAIGGTLGGTIDNSIFDFPVSMEVDYVRIYQHSTETEMNGKAKITKKESSCV